MNKAKGLIFDIKRFALHDGPGIRTTVFLKGCYLKCPWCHNPEGINPFPEFIYRKSRCLNECLKCLEVCARGIDIRSKWYELQGDKCILECGKCITVCPTEAISKVGMEMEINEILNIVLSDQKFYQVSGGGVTISGGEPLFSGWFTLSLLQSFKSAGLHTAIETCCYGNTQLLETILNYVDVVFLDIKFGNPQEYEKQVSAGDGRIIFQNIEIILASNATKVIRFPCIPNYTDSIENVTEIAEYLTKCQIKNLERFEVLPYNSLSESKYSLLGRIPPAIPKSYRLQPSEAAQLLMRYRFPICLMEPRG